MKTNRILTRSLVLSAAVLALQVQAAPINPAMQPLGYIGPIELSNTDLSNGAKAYRGWFENGNWQGDLIEYDVSSAGALTTSINFSTTSPKQTPGGTNWSAHVQFAANADTISHWDTGRKIITNKKSNEVLFKNVQQIPFRWLQLSPDQQNLIDVVSHNSNDSNSVVLNFLRGDRSNEKPSGSLRLRQSVLGDIIHSNPEYVGVPDGDYTDTSYVDFKNDNLTRAPRVYVGANDGMLHAFDATNGNEVWAYVPSMVYPRLSRLAGASYSHSYYVDGGITVRDAYINSQASWRTILVGSLGAGGKGLYVLDVTDPDLTSEVTGANKLIGELTPGIDDVGYIFDASTIAQLNDGGWYVIAGNGISSANGVAKLFLIDLNTGMLTTISTGAGGDNGLSAPALVDTDGDGKADIAYAGDIKGDMWKFDLTGNTRASWNMAYKLYDGSPTQPITMAPDIAAHPQIGQLVMFGTGKLYETADITDTNVQSIYGIWDTGDPPTGLETRLNRDMTVSIEYNDGTYAELVRTFKTVKAFDYKDHAGWKIDLPAGERVLTPTQLRAGRLKATVTNPDGYVNWYHEATYDQGGVEDESIFDLNRDGRLNTGDRVRGNGDNDFNDPEDIPMAWKRPDGNMSQVTIASLAAGVDTLFLNFLNPPIIPGPTEGCTGDCAEGLLAGHMDVDSDSGSFSTAPGGDGLGGSTDAHEHEYDDEHNVTYVDYFNIDPTNVGKPLPVDSVGIDEDEKFIVVVANADMSTGANIVLDQKTYNVVEYQRIIHRALGAWDGTSALTDPDGDPLVFTLNGIKANGGTMRTTMSSLAIISGGLIPTETGCVKGMDYLNETDRWRNGALTVQLVRLSHFTSPALGANENALERLYVQEPPDLKTPIVLSDGSQVVLTEELTGDSTLTNNNTDADGKLQFEIMGGVRAANDPEFLWETTLFWHWKEKKVCYGSDTWEERYVAVTTAVPEAVYQEMLEDAGYATWEDLVAYVEALACEAGDSQCEKNRDKAMKDIEGLYNMGLLVHGVPEGMLPPPEAQDSGTSLSGEPVIIEGGVSEGGITSGPNFDTGRRTWIDIMPE